MLNLLSPINFLSYGNVGVGLTRGLLEHNIEVALFPINKDVQTYPRYHADIKRALDNAMKFKRNSPSVRVFHQFDLAEHVGRPIGFPIFELNDFTELEKHHLNSCDLILTCSEWGKNVVESLTTRRAKVVPLGVDTQVFCPQTMPAKTKFLYIGKVELRKSVDLIPKLFAKAFTKSDDVELLVSFHNPFLPPEEMNEWIKYYKTSPLGDKITLIPFLNTLEELNNLYNQVSCGLCLSKAEGWDLPLLELMATGRKNIVTNYSGHTEFATKENSYLVDIDKLEDAYDPRWFNKGIGQWAYIGKQQEEQIISYMRQVHQKTEFNDASFNTAKEFTWRNSAKKLVEAINE